MKLIAAALSLALLGGCATAVGTPEPAARVPQP